MLRRRKISAMLTLGVARNVESPKAVSAHAWLSCGSVILVGGNDVSRYRRIAVFSAGDSPE